MYGRVDHYADETRRQGVDPLSLSTHIGFFVLWAIQRGLHNASEEDEGFEPEVVADVLARPSPEGRR